MFVLELARVDIVTRGFLQLVLSWSVVRQRVHTFPRLSFTAGKSSKALCFPCSWFVALSSCTSSSVTFSDSSTALRSNGLWVISGFCVYANSPGLSESLPDTKPISLYSVRVTKLPDKRKFGPVAHKKLRFKLHMFQNSKIIWFLMPVLSFLASFSCVRHVVRGKQKEQFFFVTPI